MKKRVLIVLFGAIGDVTRALPLAVRLKRAWPECHLTWAVEPLSRSLVEGHPSIDEVIVFQRKEGLPGYLRFRQDLRSRAAFDLTLDLQRHLKSGFTSWSSRAPRRIGFHRRNSKEFNFLFQTETIRAVDNWTQKIGHYQLFGDALGLPAVEPLDFGLHPTSEEQDKVRTLLEPLRNVPQNRRLAFILGSSWPSRFWLAERYREVAEELARSNGTRVVLIGGESEREIAEQVEASLPEVPVLNLVGKTSLRDLIALFSEMGAVVGSDSGPMHIAAAVGAPVVSLWGSTSPLRSAPYRSEDLVLQSAVGCSPCYRKNCPGLGRLCMSDIPAAAVIARLEQLRGEERIRE